MNKHIHIAIIYSYVLDNELSTVAIPRLQNGVTLFVIGKSSEAHLDL